MENRDTVTVGTGQPQGGHRVGTLPPWGPPFPCLPSCTAILPPKLPAKKPPKLQQNPAWIKNYAQILSSELLHSYVEEQSVLTESVFKYFENICIYAEQSGLYFHASIY